MALEIEYAWAAGFFDGEGSVVIGENKNPNRSRGAFALRVSVAQRDLTTLERFNSIFGNVGKIGIITNKRNQTWGQLTFTCEKAAEVLRNLMPYLVFKQEVAKLGLALADSVKATKAMGNKSLPDGVWEARKSLMNQVQWLNTGRWLAAETKPENAVSTGEAIVRPLAN